MAGSDPALTLKIAQQAGRRCHGCGKTTKEWTVIKQKRCDKCIDGSRKYLEKQHAVSCA